MNANVAVRKILLPVEFSERCRGAARYGEALACHFQAELVLLHVLTPPYAIYSGGADVAAYASVADILEERLDQARQALEAFCEAHLQPGVREVVLEGDAAGTIVEYAHQARFDLIVMPTHGYGPFRRFLLGSVTAKVLHDVDCPVWTGPHLEQAPEWQSVALRRIACAIDLEPHSPAVLGWAASMAREYGAELLIVHAVPAPPLHPHAARRPDCLKQRIEALQQELAASGEVRMETGDVPAAVTHAVRDAHADLLVIGRSRSAGVAGRLRANAYAIVRDAPCPVVSI
jgi:nucleotide-binding universal stress UspA family protein